MQRIKNIFIQRISDFQALLKYHSFSIIQNQLVYLKQNATTILAKQNSRLFSFPIALRQISNYNYRSKGFKMQLFFDRWLLGISQYCFSLLDVSFVCPRTSSKMSGILELFQQFYRKFEFKRKLVHLKQLSRIKLIQFLLMDLSNLSHLYLQNIIGEFFKAQQGIFLIKRQQLLKQAIQANIENTKIPKTYKFQKTHHQIIIQNSINHQVQQKPKRNLKKDVSSIPAHQNTRIVVQIKSSNLIETKKTNIKKEGSMRARLDKCVQQKRKNVSQDGLRKKQKMRKRVVPYYFYQSQACGVSLGVGIVRSRERVQQGLVSRNIYAKERISEWINKSRL